ncbi:MAG: hypothetical protein NDI94_05350 [Candidatus Woesearchaeota archaeon]|nr:hypothetical protein [Candidatus Woesearchaeota archaeon]
MLEIKYADSKTSKIGFIVLGSLLVLFLCTNIYEKIIDTNPNLYILALLLSFAIFLIIGLKKTYDMRLNHINYDERHNIIATMSASITGAVLTYALSSYTSLGPVISSSLVGLSSYILCSMNDRMKDHSPAVYCGTFVGMSSTFIILHPVFVTLGGLFSGVLYHMTEDAFDGEGGKLGTIAFGGVCGAVTVIMLFASIIGVF